MKLDEIYIGQKVIPFQKTEARLMSIEEYINGRRENGKFFCNRWFF